MGHSSIISIIMKTSNIVALVASVTVAIATASVIPESNPEPGPNSFKMATPDSQANSPGEASNWIIEPDVALAPTEVVPSTLEKINDTAKLQNGPQVDADQSSGSLTSRGVETVQDKELPARPTKQVNKSDEEIYYNAFYVGIALGLAAFFIWLIKWIWFPHENWKCKVTAEEWY